MPFTLVPPALLFPVQQAEAHASGTGLEWMVIASVLLPAVLLLVLIYLGSKQTV